MLVSGWYRHCFESDVLIGVERFVFFPFIFARRAKMLQKTCHCAGETKRTVSKSTLLVSTFLLLCVKDGLLRRT